MDYWFSGDSNKWDCSEVDSNSVSGFEGEGFSSTAESGTCCVFGVVVSQIHVSADPFSLRVCASKMRLLGSVCAGLIGEPVAEEGLQCIPEGWRHHHLHCAGYAGVV